jgi:hypothetical protein
MAYDIIGDIYGQADKLEALLRALGYRDTAGAWRHPDRQAIFVGDFIDRGYWLTGTPSLQSSRSVCLDYSAGNGGPLVAYRFDSEPELSAERFVWVAGRSQ